MNMGLNSANPHWPFCPIVSQFICPVPTTNLTLCPLLSFT